jgi:hypothetical protein
VGAVVAIRRFGAAVRRLHDHRLVDELRCIQTDGEGAGHIGHPPQIRNECPGTPQQAEIEATRKRDFEGWQRETILRLGTQAFEAALTVNSLISKVAFQGEQLTDGTFDPVRDAGTRIHMVATNLRFLEVQDIATRCVELRTAVVNPDLISGAADLNLAKRQDKARGDGEESDATKEASARLDQQTDALSSAESRVAVEVQFALRELRPVQKQ